MSVSTDVANEVVWTPAYGLLTSIGQTVMASPSETTTYIATATDVNGCQTSTAVTVEVSETISDIYLDFAEVTICTNQDSLTVDVGGSADSYTWSPAEGLNTTTGSSVNMFPSTPTVYTLVADYGDCISLAEIRTDIAIAPDVTVIEDQDICNGDNVMLSAEGGTFYGWTPVIGLDDPLSATPIATPAETTTYSVNIVDQDSGCETVETVVVAVSNGPEVEAGATATVCAESAYDITDATSTDINSVIWSGGLGTFSDAMSLNPSYTPVASEVGRSFIICRSDR